jgi:biopolymer transport protein ExbD
MALQLRSGNDDEDVIASINTTPLVDVMLVLLIIFLITIPVVTQTVPLSLPKVVNLPRQTKPENIEISVDREGGVYWNAQPLADHVAPHHADDGFADLVTRLLDGALPLPAVASHA